MCRKNWIPGIFLLAFGLGIGVGCCFSSCVGGFCLAGTAICGGIFVLRHR